MKDNKKQLMVVAALALVIVSVGVFQFVRGNQAPPPPRSAQKEERRAAPQVAETPKEAPKNQMFADNLPTRDPFAAEALPSTAPTPPVPPAPKQTPKPQSEIRGTVLPPVKIEGGQLGGPIGKGLSVEEEPFGFTVSGVMLGTKPMAVFTDAQGGQRLIMLGGSLGPDSEVVSIDKDAVTVRFHGKTLRLTVEGNPNAK